MKNKIRMHKLHPALLLVFFLTLLGTAVALADGSIDATDKWAWGSNSGWINFNPTHGGVTVYSDHLEGYAWAENVGWIRLGSYTGGGAHTYNNSTNSDYGVNNDSFGNLSGYAWSANSGWINFDSNHSQVTIDPVSGDFNGYAWSENVGWINFQGTAANGNSFKVNTNWRSAGNAPSIIISGFDVTRGEYASIPDGLAFAEARQAVATTYPAATFTSVPILTQSALTNTDILILSSVADGFNPISPLTAAEQTALADFVTNGGCAILMPDNSDFVPANESLIDPFGMDTTGLIWGWINSAVTNPAASAITDGPFGTISTFTQGWPGSITNVGPYGTSLAVNGSGDSLVVIERNAIASGSGRVVVYSDVTTFIDTADGGDFINNQALFLNSIAYCQGQNSPTNFTYQGFLTDDSNPANGSYDLQFELYDADTGGNQVGNTKVFDTMPVSNGLFTANLDFGAVFNGQALWLDIGVRPGGSSGAFTILSPRQPLTAVPYALYSNHTPWSGLLNVPGGFADGLDNDTTYNAGTGLLLNGGAFTLNPDYALPQSCNNGEIAEWNGSGWACGTDDTGSGAAAWSLIGNSGTNPGTNFLGTTDNQSLELHVNGNRALLIEPDATSPNLVGGYAGNSVGNVSGATIAGGGNSASPNQVTADYAAVGGGQSNIVTGIAAVVGGGQNNVITGTYGTIGGGGWNQAFGNYTTVAGGNTNVATAHGATIAGGVFNSASGTNAVVPGGYNNIASGVSSFAAGCGTRANHDGSFVWADFQNCNLSSQRDNQFSVQAYGGVYLEDGVGNVVDLLWSQPITTSTGAYLSWGGTWTNASDVNLKENFETVDSQEVLEAVANLPIQTWNYKAEDEDVRHVGPTAQDFQAAFGLGASDTAIGTVDADGVALTAVQALYQRTQEQETQIATLQAENEALAARLTALESRLAQSSRLNQPASGLWLWWLPILGLLGGGLVVTKRRFWGGVK
ncbi:MAG: hypothetical protein GY796_30600 [Chloroflexi bacterium]|nr:hypothetical protein [Chloroflexota bacterium]